MAQERGSLICIARITSGACLPTRENSSPSRRSASSLVPCRQAPGSRAGGQSCVAGPSWLSVRMISVSRGQIARTALHSARRIQAIVRKLGLSFRFQRSVNLYVSLKWPVLLLTSITTMSGFAAVRAGRAFSKVAARMVTPRESGISPSHSLGGPKWRKAIRIGESEAIGFVGAGSDGGAPPTTSHA